MTMLNDEWLNLGLYIVIGPYWHVASVGQALITNELANGFYRAMHFSAKRGIAIACCLSVRLSVCLSVTLVNCDHIG